MKIEIAFRYDRAEMLYIHRLAKRRQAVLRYMISALLLSLAAFPLSALVVRAFLLGAALALPVLAEVRMRSSARLAARQKDVADRLFTITEEAFTSTSGAVTRTLEWAKMHSVRRNGDWWRLHISEKEFLLLPVRALDAGQRAEFERFLINRGWGKLITG